MSEVAESYWTSLPVARGVTLLQHDENGVVAFDKPAGVLSHPNSRDDHPRSLLTVHYDFEGEFFTWSEGEVTRRLWLLNRLDSATSGVILAASDEAVAREIRAGFKRRRIRKVYYAVVFGAPAIQAQFWRDMLTVERRGGTIRTSAGHIPCETQMSVVRRGAAGPAQRSLLKLEPHTGRSHQLRVQCAKRHLPIVGDATYGDFRGNREFARAMGTKRLFLHSAETSFSYEWHGKTWNFTARAPAPVEFEKAL